MEMKTCNLIYQNELSFPRGEVLFIWPAYLHFKIQLYSYVFLYRTEGRSKSYMNH